MVFINVGVVFCLLFSFVYSQNILLFCGQFVFVCDVIDTSLANIGYAFTRIDGRPLTDTDFTGINVFIDGTTNSGSDCGPEWSGTTVLAISNFLSSGNPI